jgi:hypothetical protein
VISRTLVAVAATSLALGSSSALAQSADPLSVNGAPAVERAAAGVDAANDLRGTTGWIIGAIALGLIIWGALELFEDDEPESP